MEMICKHTGKTFTISDKEKQYCEERGIPLSTTEPNTLLRWMQSFRNRVHLYNTTCASSGKPILSCFPPDKGYRVYESTVWNSDSWDGLTYGQDYDASKSFFEQFNNLLHQVPLPNLYIVNTGEESNSKYVNGAKNLRNCYLCFTTLDSEDCMFCWNVFNSKNMLDCVYCLLCELCYDSIDLSNCYNVSYAESCVNCSDSYFLLNCQGCKNCFGCVNLSNKEYCWYNEQLTKAEYEQRKSQFNFSSNQTIQAEKNKFAAFQKQFPVKYYKGKNNENTTGSYLLNNQNCTNCFLTNNSQDVENAAIALKSKDCFGIFSITESQLGYHTVTGANYNNRFCLECIHCQNLEFCMYCVNNCSDCFGCIGLKKKQYCILNKQYSKEEYEHLTKKIKANMIATGEWCDFFPQAISPLYYNHSDAATFFPLTRDQAITAGFSWKEEDSQNTAANNDLPDDSSQVDISILEKTFSCANTQKAFRFTKQELDFYQSQHIPLPKVAPLERILQRATVLAIKPLQTIHCATCNVALKSVYNSTEQTILCEECYQKQL